MAPLSGFMYSRKESFTINHLEEDGRSFQSQVPEASYYSSHHGYNIMSHLMDLCLLKIAMTQELGTWLSGIMLA